MHPYDHALSSARTHGGQAQDYLAFHNWFDATKSVFAHFTHRFLRHHREGVLEAIRIFGTEIRNADKTCVPTRTLGLQHLSEDCGHIPTATDWLESLEALDLLPRTITTADELAEQSALRFGGAAGDYQQLHAWFLSTGAWFDFKDPRHLAMRHHSFGIFEAEARFGIVLTPANSRPVPTRIVAEHHVRTIIGRIPATTEFLRRIRAEHWMATPSPAKRLH